MKEVYSLDHLSDEYSGCGHGWIKIDKSTDQVVQMSYATDPLQIVHEQNVECFHLSFLERTQPLMEDDEFLWMRCNFSCYQACRF